jgi:hypothetical protein
VHSPTYAYAYLDARAGCAGYGVGAAAIPGGEVVCGFELAVFSERAVVWAFRDFGLGVFLRARVRLLGRWRPGANNGTGVLT